MSKTHLDLVAASPDPVKLGIQLRALTSGRRKPKAATVPLWGNMEGYVKEDPEFGLQFVKRKMTSQIKSEEVKKMNKAMRVCAAVVDEKIQSKREGGAGVTREYVRELFSKCLRAKPQSIEEARSVIG